MPKQRTKGAEEQARRKPADSLLRRSRPPRLRPAGTAASRRRTAHVKRKVRKAARPRRTITRRTAGQLKRSRENPILGPQSDHVWEAKATFNPAALYRRGVVHLLYRAIGSDDVSTLGYAASADGRTIQERSPVPAYVHARCVAERSYGPRIEYGSGGGGNGGCEDPRLVEIGGRVYLIYTAFDGWGSVREALSSIGLDDFLKRDWHWKPHVFISPPEEIHKNWVLFPEKIHGKYAILHSISPTVQVAYVDSLDEFDGSRFIEGSVFRQSFDPEGSQTLNGMPARPRWDSWVRGAGPPPIRTKHGWLLLYHAMDRRDPNRYKLGALLLSLDDPTRVVARSREPILEPDEQYENEGHKAGVVYSCGAVLVGGDLHVFYGGADTVVCVASATLDRFLDALRRGGAARLRRVPKPSD